MKDNIIKYTVVEMVSEFLDASYKWLDENKFNNKSKTILGYGLSYDVYFSEDPDEIGMRDIDKSIEEVFKEGDIIHGFDKSKPIYELLNSFDEGEKFTLGGRIFEMVYMDLEEEE